MGLSKEYLDYKLAQAQAQPINAEAYCRILDTLFDDTKITDYTELMNLRAACMDLAEYVQGGYSIAEYIKIVNQILERNDLETTGEAGKTNRSRAMGIANNIHAMQSPNKLLGTKGKPNRGFEPPPATNSIIGYTLYRYDGKKVPK